MAQMGSSKREKKIKKIKKRSWESVENGEIARDVHNDDTHPNAKMNEEDVAGADMKSNKSKKARKNKNKDTPSSSAPSVVANDADNSCEEEKRKSKKVHKQKDEHSTNKITKSSKEVKEDTMCDVYQISSGEEDDSKGMKKWIKEFHKRIPGLKVLQDRIDKFITAHEEQEEQQRRERETKLNEDGWTVVVHCKGGKRTTDSESGVAVGSVAEAAVREKMSKKKSKDFGLDFYRFQRKEAQRSEVMKLQSKFEEDKKRIQQIRAARKFKPY